MQIAKICVKFVGDVAILCATSPTNLILYLINMRFRSIFKVVASIILLVITSVGALAQDSIPAMKGGIVDSLDIDLRERSNTFLVINSYTEYSPWSRAMITPITYYIANDDRVHAELINLNSAMITDSATYATVREQFFKTYKDRKISYVVFIGQMAFTFRDRIKEEWGDIPMLLITRDLTVADTDYYYSGYAEREAANDNVRSLADLKEEYNFTVIYTPDYYKETIELMNRLIPDMDELVFFSDAAYYNRSLSKNIEIFLLEEYPTIKFRWIQANVNTDENLQYYLVHTVPHTGLLMSSWVYEKMGAFGHPALVMGDLNLLFSSTNPVFSLRHAYMDLGAIGGVYPDPELVNKTILDRVKRIVDGENPRDIKFLSNYGNSKTIINYPLLRDYDLKAGNCPEYTVFVNKPLSFWQKYYWQGITVFVAVLLMTILFVRRNLTLRKENRALERNKRFIENMPVPYSKAKIKYNQSMQVVNIEYVLTNHAFEEIIAENGQKHKAYILFPAKMISEKTAEMLETGRPVSFLHHFEHTDKYFIFTLCIVDRRRKDAIEFVDMIDIFAVDVTKRIRDEHRMREITQRLDLTLNVANIIPWEWNLDSDMMYFGATNLFRRYDKLGQTDPDKQNWAAIPSREYMSMVAKEDREELRHVREQFLLGAISQFHMEYRLVVPQHGQDSVEWLDVNGAVSERDEDGKIKKVIGSILLITDRKRQEIELMEANEKVLEADSMKAAFISNISYEIRTPLNAIVNFSQLMCETDDPEKKKEYSKIITQNNNALLSVIGDVLAAPMIDSEKLDVKPVAVDVNALMRSVGDAIRPRLRNGVVINVVNGAPKCVAMLDGEFVKQVMMGLLSNACKFTPKGSITYGYEIVDGKELQFYVRDTGIGIDNVDQLLNRRVAPGPHGAGFGLSVGRSLVERMGGYVGVESKGEGKGSNFWFSLPYIPAPDEKSHAPKPNITSPGGTVITGAPTNGEDIDGATHTSETMAPDIQPIASGRVRPLILVAEDIEGNYLLLKAFLDKEYDLIHAWNGKDAVKMCADEHPDLVLMDISMPVMDGYEATREIRKTKPNLPIIAVTAYAYVTDRKKMLQNGFSDYVPKPVNRLHLRQAIKKFLV